MKTTGVFSHRLLESSLAFNAVRFWYRLSQDRIEPQNPRFWHYPPEEFLLGISMMTRGY
jgi:hypothetical protein